MFARYAVVGAASNLLVYVGYLLIASSGIGHMAAMSMTYAAGTLLAFQLNRRWTFGSDAAIRATLPRFLLSYAAGYLLDLAGLFVFVDLAGMPHQLVQAALIVSIAAILFVLQRRWVFSHAK